MIDTCGFDGDSVALTAAALADRVGHYGFVSSGSAYADWPNAPVDEDSPLWQDGDDYGAGKADAERAAEAAMPGRVLIARAGVIVGPHENIGRLPRWLRRLVEGGDVLAPGPPAAPMQLIDARDLAAWMLDMAAAGRAGAYNAIAEPGSATWGELLETAREVTGGGADLRWVDPAFVEEHVEEPWVALPLWPIPSLAGLYRHGGCAGRGGGPGAAPATRDDRGHVGLAGGRRPARRLAPRAARDGALARGGARAAQSSVVKNSRSRDSRRSGIASSLTSRVKCSDAMCASYAASSSYCS